MSTMYVFQNELLGDDGDQFEDALIDQRTGTHEELLIWFNENYDNNDYSASFTKP